MRKGALVLAVCALAGAAALWQLQPASGPQAAIGLGASPHGNVAGSSAQPGAGGASGAPLAAGRARGAAPAPGSDPLLAQGLRDAIEALLLAAGDAPDPESLKQRLEGLVGQQFPPELATRALALARRYVDYRVALGKLKAPADTNDPRALREAMDQRQTLRQQHFDTDEFDALFAQEMQLDRYMLARLEIERNTALSADQKRQALADAEAGLDAPTRAQRAEAVAHVGVAQQTAAFNAQGVDDHTRHQQRSAQYGQEAAHRLAQLDREERDWNARLDQYQQAALGRADATQLQQLRAQLFTPEEQLRIEAALAMRK